MCACCELLLEFLDCKNQLLCCVVYYTSADLVQQITQYFIYSCLCTNHFIMNTTNTSIQYCIIYAIIIIMNKLYSYIIL